VIVTALEVVGGIALVCLIFLDVFASIIVPRPVGSTFRLSSQFNRFAWPIWRRIGSSRRSERSRETYLGIFAPAAIIVSFALWLVGLIVGYALLVLALSLSIDPRPLGFGDALYCSSTWLTLGHGLCVPIGGVARFVSIVAASSGLGTFAIVVAYLFLLFGSFQRRENFVIVLDASAGAPPSGIRILETHVRLGMRGDLKRLFADGQRWAAEILETHLAYPMLGYFRSTHRDESWISALGAMLDAATLIVTAVKAESGDAGQARLMVDVGTHLSEDLCRYFRIPAVREPGIQRDEFESVLERLARAGYRLNDREVAWRFFRNLRGKYAMPLERMATYWAIPSALWMTQGRSARH